MAVAYYHTVIRHQGENRGSGWSLGHFPKIYDDNPPSPTRYHKNHPLVARVQQLQVMNSDSELRRVVIDRLKSYVENHFVNVSDWCG